MERLIKQSSLQNTTKQNKQSKTNKALFPNTKQSPKAKQAKLSFQTATSKAPHSALVRIQHGPHKANRTQIHRGESPTQTVGNESRPEERPSHWRREETAPVQARNCRPS